MNVVLLGVTGLVRYAILKKALDRGHRVIANARDPENLEKRDGLIQTRGEVYDTASVAGETTAYEQTNISRILCHCGLGRAWNCGMFEGSRTRFTDSRCREHATHRYSR